MNNNMVSKFIIPPLLLVTFFLFIAVPPLFAEEPKSLSDIELNQLLKNIEKKFSNVKTLRTQFVQEKNIAFFSEAIISTGFCMFKSAGKLRLDFIKPFASSLIVNNNEIFKYEFFNGAWQKLPTGNEEMMLLVMENITRWLQGRFRDPDLYRIKAVKNETISVFLTPIAEEFRKFILSFELGLNPEMNGIDYIIINETKSNYTKIQFHNDETNKEINDIIFDGTKDKPHSVLQW